MVVLWKILREKYNKMGDQSLIRGAALAAPKFNDIGAAVKKGVSGVSEFILARNAEKRQEERAQKAKVERYLNNMPSGIELSKIPPAQQENVANWSKQMKFEYAEAARVLPSLDPGSDEYIEAMNKITSVKQAFSNLNNNLETHKANKTEYLKSSSSGALSKGNNSKQGNMLANIYTDGADMIFDVNGNMAFQSGEQVLNLNDIPDYFNKDFKSADTLININSDIYNAGQKLDPTMSNMYRQKILNMIRQGGRETTLSLATDDLIQEGGLGIVDEDLLYNPERQEELEQVVVDNYMNILNSSAESGFKKKADAAAAAASAKSNNNKSNPFKGYGQANEDFLNTTSGFIEESFNDTNKGVVEDPSLIVGAIKNIDPQSDVSQYDRNTFFEMWSKSEDVRNTYGSKKSRLKEVFDSKYNTSVDNFLVKSSGTVLEIESNKLNDSNYYMSILIKSADGNTVQTNALRNYFKDKTPNEPSSQFVPPTQEEKDKLFED